MPFLPETFCDVAKTINAGAVVAPGEARFRTIVGRAYYGAYWATCTAVCKTHGISPPADLPHDALCRVLADKDKPIDVREVGILLNGLRLSRVTSDYKPLRTVTRDDADDAVTDAERIVSLLPSVETRLPKVDPASQ